MLAGIWSSDPKQDRMRLKGVGKYRWLVPCYKPSRQPVKHLKQGGATSCDLTTGRKMSRRSLNKQNSRLLVKLEAQKEGLQQSPPAAKTPRIVRETRHHLVQSICNQPNQGGTRPTRPAYGPGSTKSAGLIQEGSEGSTFLAWCQANCSPFFGCGG